MASADRLYEQFKPVERAVLTIEALARGDRGEEDRLRQTCPRRAYTMTEPAFHETLDFIHDLTLITLVDLRWHLGKLHLVEVFRGLAPQLTRQHALAARVSFFEGLLFGQGESAMTGMAGTPAQTSDTPVEADDAPEPLSPEDAARWDIPEQLLADADATLQRIIAPTIDGLAKDFRSCWSAYDTFVRETFDLDPLLVLRAFCPQIADQVKVALAAYAKIEPDVQVVNECMEAMKLAWERC